MYPLAFETMSSGDSGTVYHPSSAESLKNEGNSLAKVDDYSKAITKYTEALHILSTEDEEAWTSDYPNPYAILYSNIAFCYTQLDNYEEAIHYGIQCIQSEKQWAKGYYRLGIACQLFYEYVREQTFPLSASAALTDTGRTVDGSNREDTIKLEEWWLKFQRINKTAHRLLNYENFGELYLNTWETLLSMEPSNEETKERLRQAQYDYKEYVLFMKQYTDTTTVNPPKNDTDQERMKDKSFSDSFPTLPDLSILPISILFSSIAHIDYARMDTGVEESPSSSVSSSSSSTSVPVPTVHQQHRQNWMQKYWIHNPLSTFITSSSLNPTIDVNSLPNISGEYELNKCMQIPLRLVNNLPNNKGRGLFCVSEQYAPSGTCLLSEPCFAWLPTVPATSKFRTFLGPNILRTPEILHRYASIFLQWRSSLTLNQVMERFAQMSPFGTDDSFSNVRTLTISDIISNVQKFSSFEGHYDNRNDYQHLSLFGYCSSLINHSCAPNAIYSTTWDNNLSCPRIRIHALRPIEPNEEITINYLGDDNIGYSGIKRKYVLKQQRQFSCACLRCTARYDDIYQIVCPHGCSTSTDNAHASMVILGMTCTVCHRLPLIPNTAVSIDHEFYQSTVDNLYSLFSCIGMMSFDDWINKREQATKYVKFALSNPQILEMYYQGLSDAVRCMDWKLALHLSNEILVREKAWETFLNDRYGSCSSAIPQDERVYVLGNLQSVCENAFLHIINGQDDRASELFKQAIVIAYTRYVQQGNGKEDPSAVEHPILTLLHSYRTNIPVTSVAKRGTKELLRLSAWEYIGCPKDIVHCWDNPWTQFTTHRTSTIMNTQNLARSNHGSNSGTDDTNDTESDTDDDEDDGDEVQTFLRTRNKEWTTTYENRSTGPSVAVAPTDTKDHRLTADSSSSVSAVMEYKVLSKQVGKEKLNELQKEAERLVFWSQRGIDVDGYLQQQLQLITELKKKKERNEL